MKQKGNEREQGRSPGKSIDPYIKRVAVANGGAAPSIFLNLFFFPFVHTFPPCRCDMIGKERRSYLGNRLQLLLEVELIGYPALALPLPAYSTLVEHNCVPLSTG